MGYSALAVGLADELLIQLASQLTVYDLSLESTPIMQEANRRLSQRAFHLLITNLDQLRNISQVGWLGIIRRNSYLPIMVLSRQPERDTSGAVELGADICLSSEIPCPVIADLAHALVRRYIHYNHYKNPCDAEVAAFRLGDISIDPARHTVEVRGRPVDLRPREFSLLLYFMQNPDIVLTAEQICEKAWGTEGIYEHGVGHPVRLLRLAIEPDPQNPIYIETVYRVGYRFTAKNVEKR